MSFHANPPMIDPENKEKLIRTRPNELGFDLEKDGFDYSIRDRREKIQFARTPADKMPRS
jgi:hypothetical protein